jgi:CspA family cold shock protein
VGYYRYNSTFAHYKLNKLSNMSKGTVKFFNETKGFGFIIEDGSNQDHFVHVSGLIDEIREGDSVEFELTEGKKGMNAVNVKIA